MFYRSFHGTVTSMFHMAQHPRAMQLLETEFPWKLASIMLHKLLASCGRFSRRTEDLQFPRLEKDDTRPFPDYFAIHGLEWTDDHFPENWFANAFGSLSSLLSSAIRRFTTSNSLLFYRVSLWNLSSVPLQFFSSPSLMQFNWRLVGLHVKLTYCEK